VLEPIPRKRGFTLIELLVVITVITVLIAITLPALRYSREQGNETVCKSNLRQMGIILKTYTNEYNSRFPNPTYIYHHARTFGIEPNPYARYLRCCRWHDARIGFTSDLMQNDPNVAGSLTPYIGKPDIVLCKKAEKALNLRGCNNRCFLVAFGACFHNPNISVDPQYSYSMNAFLGSSIKTGIMSNDNKKSMRTIRLNAVHTETQVTRSPSEVFAFGEENSWAVNRRGWQPLPSKDHWPAPYDLSSTKEFEPLVKNSGTLRRPALRIMPTLHINSDNQFIQYPGDGDSFATYHRPPKEDLNAGYSFLVMLDGHVKKVTVSDQLRRSRQVPEVEPSQYGPGGNLALAWPIDIDPPGGWDAQ